MPKSKETPSQKIKRLEKELEDEKLRTLLLNTMIDVRNVSVKEIFGSGTAAVVNPIIGSKHNDFVFELPKQDNTYADKFKDILLDIQYNKSEDPYGWRIDVK